MTPIEQTVASLIETIGENQSLYTSNESAVCDHIIKPLLHTLGWQITAIVPNQRMTEGFPDYTLWKDGKKKLLVEAKKLHRPLDSKAVRQLGKYLFSEGVRHGLLTDGARYILYRSFQEGSPFKKNVIWKVDLESDDLPYSVGRLMTLAWSKIDQLEDRWKRREEMEGVWLEMTKKVDDFSLVMLPAFKDNLHNIHPDQTYDETDERDFVREHLSALLGGELPPPPLPPPPPPPPPPDGGWHPYTAGSRPGRMQIETESFQPRKSKDILVLTAEWLIKRGKLKVPVPTGRRYLVAHSSLDPSGKPFHASHSLSNGAFLETTFSSPSCEEQARIMLKFCGLSNDLLKVDWVK